MRKFTPTQVVCGKPLLEWFKNKELQCFGGWPDEVQAIAVHRDMQIPFKAMHRHGGWSTYRKCDGKLQPGGVYRLWDGHEWLKPGIDLSGEFVEYLLDKNGDYTFTIDNATIRTYWGNINPLGQVLAFAGWIWHSPQSDRSFTDTERFGYDAEGTMTGIAANWVKPATPTGVRFWKKIEDEAQTSVNKPKDDVTVVVEAANALAKVFEEHKLCLSAFGDGTCVITYVNNSPLTVIENDSGEDIEAKDIYAEIEKQGWNVPL